MLFAFINEMFVPNEKGKKENHYSRESLGKLKISQLESIALSRFIPRACLSSRFQGTVHSRVFQRNTVRCSSDESVIQCVF